MSMEQFLENVGGEIAEQLQGIPITCPKCGDGFKISRKIAYEDTEMSLVLNFREGHMLQMQTVGGTMTEVAKLVKAMAREMGAKVEVLFTSVVADAASVRVNFCIVQIPKRSSK